MLMGGALAVLGIDAGGAGLGDGPRGGARHVPRRLHRRVGRTSALPAGPRRPHLLGVAAGALYGSADVATKAATTAAHAGGLAHGLLSPWVLAIALASAGGFFCLQRGLAAGPVLAVIALMTAVTNVVAILGGLLVFSEPLGVSAITGALHASRCCSSARRHGDCPSLRHGSARPKPRPRSAGPRPPQARTPAHAQPPSGRR